MGLPPVLVRFPDGELTDVPAVELPVTLMGEIEVGAFDEIIQSWDLAFKDLKTSDYVAGGVWARKGANKYLLDQVHDRMDFPQTIQAIRAMSRKWPACGAKLIEDKANGPAVIQTLRDEIPGIVEVDPKGGKFSRASAISSHVEAGNIFLPHPRLGRWVNLFIHEASVFPAGAHDDQVDQMTQALVRLGHFSNRGTYDLYRQAALEKRQLEENGQPVASSTTEHVGLLGGQIERIGMTPIVRPIPSRPWNK
jgi:predicted phage terminase large subunit-like protein